MCAWSWGACAMGKNSRIGPSCDGWPSWILIELVSWRSNILPVLRLLTNTFAVAQAVSDQEQARATFEWRRGWSGYVRKLRLRETKQPKWYARLSQKDALVL